MQRKEAVQASGMARLASKSRVGSRERAASQPSGAQTVPAGAAGAGVQGGSRTKVHQYELRPGGLCLDLDGPEGETVYLSELLLNSGAETADKAAEEESRRADDQRRAHHEK